MNFRLGMMLLCGAAVVAGCRSRPEVGAGASTVRLAAAEASGDEALWGAVQDSLRDYRFRIDRVDRREGVVTTLPETSKQLFEFWRKDAVTAYDVWESTINPIRRWVEVRVADGPESAERNVAVTVHKERLSSPDRQFNNSTAAYRFFGDALPSTTGIVRVTPEHDRWLSMGRDPALEARLVDQIVLRSQADVLEREVTSQPSAPEVSDESQPLPQPEPAEQPSIPTTIEVTTSEPAVSEPPSSPAESSPTTGTEGDAAIVPMQDVDESTPMKQGGVSDESSQAP
jgi:hypothetical protein